MLGRPIAARPLARDGLGLLGSDFGRTRLAEAPVPPWGRAAAPSITGEQAARETRAPAAPATRP